MPPLFPLPAPWRYLAAWKTTECAVCSAANILPGCAHLDTTKRPSSDLSHRGANQEVWQPYYTYIKKRGARPTVNGKKMLLQENGLPLIDKCQGKIKTFICKAGHIYLGTMALFGFHTKRLMWMSSFHQMHEWNWVTVSVHAAITECKQSAFANGLLL